MTVAVQVARDVCEAMLQLRDLALGATVRDDHITHLETVLAAFASVLSERDSLFAAVDTRTRENAAFVSAVREAIGFCEGDESPEELVSFVQSMSERIPELTRERDALREAVETKDRAHGMAVDREFAAIARADRYRAALEALALVSDAEVERLARETYHEIGGPPSGMTPAWETMSPGFRVNRMAFVRAGMQGAAPTLGEVLKVYGGRK